VILPPAVPEIPVADLAAALAYYRDNLGFTVDWADEEYGPAGVSQDHCRLFLASPRHRSSQANTGPVVIWLNLANRGEIDTLFERWSATGARIAEPPSAKPWKLYEFLAGDLDGNALRVFYDFAWEEREPAPN
jgi:uncharacterized glyoxalase superfamily protein PhnB